MSSNEFGCLSNAILQASLCCEIPVAFTVPGHVRTMLQNVDVVNVRTVTLHQCPASKGVVDYTIGVDMCTGLHKTREFRSVGVPAVHDSFVLYDRMRDGVMQYLHLLH